MLKKNFFFSLLIFLSGLLAGGFVQQLRLDEVENFYRNSLIRLKIISRAYDGACIQLGDLIAAAKAAKLDEESVVMSPVPGGQIYFVETGPVEAFSKDRGKMKFKFDSSQGCLTF